jgi:hypothetical protein
MQEVRGWRVVEGERFVDRNSTLFRSNMLFLKLWEEEGTQSGCSSVEKEIQDNYLTSILPIFPC